MREKIKKMNTNSLELILASGSPRRQAFFKEMGLSFRVEVVPVAEDFPAGLNGIQTAEHIVRQKAEPFLAKIQEKQLIITADTVVWHQNQSLGKPENAQEAKAMLKTLSNSTHEVITAVGFLQKGSFETLCEVSKVTFGILSEPEIERYVQTGSPLDKAGAYGIQDPFGVRHVTRIEGSYSNIIGLPVPQVLKKIQEITVKN